MSQPVAGVAPSQLSEVTAMTVWPSIAAIGPGRWLGRVCMIQAGRGFLPFNLTLGKLLAFALIPVALVLFAGGIAPGVALRYRLTNRRLLVEKGLRPAEVRSVSLDRFNNIEIEVLPGQEWYPAGDLIFRLDQIETFRLQGVPRPETFRHTCLKAQQSFVGVQKAREAGVAV